MSGYSTDWKVAADPQKSAWVSANAGSGKTHVLAQRVIRLLETENVKQRQVMFG